MCQTLYASYDEMGSLLGVSHNCIDEDTWGHLIHIWKAEALANQVIYACHSLVSRKDLGTKLVTVGWVASLLFIADSHRLWVDDGKGNLLPGSTSINVFWLCLQFYLCVYTYAIPSGSLQMKLGTFPTHQLIALGNIGWFLHGYVFFGGFSCILCQ